MYQKGPLGHSLIAVAQLLSPPDSDLLELAADMEEDAPYTRLRYPEQGTLTAPCDQYRTNDAIIAVRRAKEVLSIISKRF